MPLGLVAHTQLPYCLQKTSDGRWLVLNRNYKPLGVTSKEWVDYDGHPDRLMLHSRTVAAIAKAAVRVIADRPSDPGIIYLYDEATMPTESAANWGAYAKRLSLLMHAKT
jgi:hypothetical protein